jgi:hypothetical protein
MGSLESVSSGMVTAAPGTRARGCWLPRSVPCLIGRLAGRDHRVGQERARLREGATIPVRIMAAQTSSHLLRGAAFSPLHTTDICQPPARDMSIHCRPESGHTRYGSPPTHAWYLVGS